MASREHGPGRAAPVRRARPGRDRVPTDDEGAEERRADGEGADVMNREVEQRGTLATPRLTWTTTSTTGKRAERRTSSDPSARLRT